jgi:hypothetical protein
MFEDFLMAGLSRGATLMVGAPVPRLQHARSSVPQPVPSRPIRGTAVRLGHGLIALGERLTELGERQSAQRS